MAERTGKGPCITLLIVTVFAGLSACNAGDVHKGSADPDRRSTDHPVMRRVRPDATFAPTALPQIESRTVESSVEKVTPNHLAPVRLAPSDIYVPEVPTPARTSPHSWGKGYFVGETTESSETAAPPSTQEEPVPNAPVPNSSFDSTNFNTNITNTGGSAFIPPDPIAAAGPSHLVNVVNVTIRFHQKNGALDLDASLASFFSALSPANFTFDPKVVYDQFAGRFVVVTLEKVNDLSCATASACTSRILVAVSDDSNPNGTWIFTAIDAETSISSTNHWADYPGLALDEETIYVTANMFPFLGSNFGGVRLWIIDKGLGAGGFYDGGTADVSVLDPYSGAGLATTTQPAHIYGTAPSGVGTFLVSYSGLTNGTNESVQVVRLDDPLGTPSLTQEFVPVTDIDNTSQVPMPDAPQSGTTTLIEVNDRRALNAVWRNDSLWLAATISPSSGPDVGETTAHWWELDTSSLGATTLADQGSIGGEDIASDAYTFFPSIAVNSFEEVAIGFSASASAIYPGSYYTTRSDGDPAGTTSGSQALRAGTDYYVRTFGGSRNRWGDYSGTVVDPSTDCFWIYNEHALARGTPTGSEDGRWGTAYANVCSGFGSITIRKETVPNADPTVFSFTGDITTSLADGQAATATPLRPGTYTVSESVPSNWRLSSILCNDSNSSGAGNTATINVEPNEAVTCVFTNTKRSYIRVRKETLPDGNPQAFNFTGAISATLSDGQTSPLVEVQPGQHTVAETIPSGWQVLTIGCDDANSSGTGNTATYNVELGETVTCTFTNSEVTGRNFYTLTPCRVVDTRNAPGPFGGPALSAATERSFALAGQCGIPAAAGAVSVNVTVTQPTERGHLRIYPTGGSLPTVSTINYRSGQTRANNAVLVLGASGATTVFVGGQTSGTVHFILDINGYFQ